MILELMVKFKEGADPQPCAENAAVAIFRLEM